MDTFKQPTQDASTWTWCHSSTDPGNPNMTAYIRHKGSEAEYLQHDGTITGVAPFSDVRIGPVVYAHRRQVDIPPGQSRLIVIESCRRLKVEMLSPHTFSIGQTVEEMQRFDPFTEGETTRVASFDQYENGENISDTIVFVAAPATSNAAILIVADTWNQSGSPIVVSAGPITAQRNVGNAVLNFVGGNIEVSFSGLPSLVPVGVHYSTDLVNWIFLTSVTTTALGAATVTDIERPRVFYKGIL